MDMRLYFGILILLCATTVDVSAGLISSGADLVDQIKPNLTTRSKPTSQYTNNPFLLRELDALPDEFREAQEREKVPHF